MSKTIEIPTLLPYPPLHPLKDVPEILDRICYIIEPYPLEGVGVVVSRDTGDVCFRLCNFDGNPLEPEDEKYSEMFEVIFKKLIPRVVYTMKLIGIAMGQFYFACIEDPILVDLQLSMNKFCSPGYLEDIFGKQGLPVQKNVDRPILLDKENLKKLKDGVGNYKSGHFIIKPSTFKSIIRGDKILPMYGVLNNETQPAT